MNYSKIWPCLLCLFVTLTFPVRAALSPENQARRTLEDLEKGKQFRLEAQVQIELEVGNVSSTFYKNDDCPQETVWQVDAKVKSVTRGSLRVGDDIHLTYSTRAYLCPSPVSFDPRALKPGQEVVAYLNCEASQCRLAAGAWSFISEEHFIAIVARAKKELEQFQDPRTVVSNPLYQRLLYFDFRSDKLAKHDEEMLKAHAAYLVQHPNKYIILRAHTDEGRSLYDEVVLGEKRGVAVMKVLLKLGVNPKQIEVQSVGNFNPCSTSGPLKSRHDNRRVFLLYPELHWQFSSDCKPAMEAQL